MTEVEQIHQEKIEELEEERAKLIEALNDTLASAAGELGQFQNINWDRLRQEDPDRYKDLRLAYVEAQERADSQAKQRKSLQEAHQKLIQMKQEAFYKAQSELAKKLLPDFGKPEFHQVLVNYGKEMALPRMK